MKDFWRYKLQGGALYYTVFISLIISLILGFFVLATLYKNRYLEAQIKRDAIVSNVYSGINLLLSDPNSLSFDFPEIIDLYAQGKDQIHLEKQRWGVFQLFISKAIWRDFHYGRIALIGEDVFQNEGIGLYLSDQGKYLSLSGNTTLSGICYIPKLGIRRASIEGQGFTKEKLIDGPQKVSANKLPAINPEVIHDPEFYLGGGKSSADSLVYFQNVPFNAEINNSFLNNPLFIYSEEEIILDQINLSGNIRIVSERSIQVNANSNLEDVILYASKIVINMGFSGKLQVFATNRITLEENCTLNYPSVLGLISSRGIEAENDQPSESTIIINKNTVIAGCVLMKNDQQRSTLVIGDGVKLFGQVYCQGRVEHKGAIIGTLYCDILFLTSGASMYENHLLNAAVDFNALSRNYVGLNITSGLTNPQIIKWLN